jgi:AraC family transcriptional regulator of adaptative response/methylated-DNA-[protein]-cysteine methyltransferase
MTPEKYRRGAIATRIRYTFTDSPLGCMLLAATDKGLCAIQFADSEEELEQGLKHEFPFAQRQRDDDHLRSWTRTVLGRLAGNKLNAALPLDIQATAFQRRVWEYLQTIPYGSTRSYSDVADAIGHPKATRAVARACASNRIAVAIPCHRVVRSNGALGGYRWGLRRKQELLDLESRAGKAASAR